MPAPVSSGGLSLPLTAGPIPSSLGIAGFFSLGGTVFAQLNDGTNIALGGGVPTQIAQAGADVSCGPAGGISGNTPPGQSMLFATGNGFRITSAALSFEITAAGEILLNGNPGVAGQRITSAGAGLPVFWS